jgi:crotonobetainyl-CoA:carnitine CoA-transferase CaiB-like acyl-CoA transferase
MIERNRWESGRPGTTGNKLSEQSSTQNVGDVGEARMLKAPLSGVSVVELGADVAVRYCGRLFAQLGATVLRTPNLNPPTQSAAFEAWLNQEKHMGKNAHEALENLERLPASRKLVIAGQTHEAVRFASNLVDSACHQTTLLALTWFDSRGPYCDWQGNDAVLQALAGIAFGFGEPEGPPILPQGFAPQILGGLVGFIAALGALVSDTVFCTRVDVNILESALCFAEVGAVALAGTDIKVQRMGVNRFSPICPCNIYATADGDIGVTALTLAQWTALAKMIGRPDMAVDPRYETTLGRHTHFQEIDAVLAAAFRAQTCAHWIEQGEKARVPITPAPRPGRLPSLEHWQVRESFSPIISGREFPKGPTLPFHLKFGGASSARPKGGPKGPLHGIRVADFSMGWAGPLAARYLGDLGADVLKVESSARPDWWRGWEKVDVADPPASEIQRNFLAVNRNKRGLDIDLSRPEGKVFAEQIIRLSDVVIENQGPGVMDKLGVGPSDQRRLNPKVTSISMPAFGRTGPLAGVRAYGSTVEQASGMPFINGRAEWAPCLQHVAYGDAVAGLYGAAAALICLYARDTLGGAEVDLGQVECLVQLNADAIIFEQVSRAPFPRTGSRRMDCSPCVVVRTTGADNWLAVAVDSDDAWRGLCVVIGRSDLAADSEIGTLAGRKAREDSLEDIVAGWAGGRDSRSAAQLLQQHGVPAAPVLAVHDLVDDPQLEASKFWARQTRRYVGEHLTPQPPFRYDGKRPILNRSAPTLGEHTQEILVEIGIKKAPN